MSDKKQDVAVVQISPDSMTATISLAPDAMGFTIESITNLLKENGVKQGIIKSVVEELAEGKMQGEAIVVAEGKAPVDGEDGRFELLFISREKLEITQEVEYKQLNLFEMVNQGQPLAVYIPATVGKFGYNVRGQLINPKRGKDMPPIKGKGLVLSEDRKMYTAATNGRITYEDGRIDITKVLLIDTETLGRIGSVEFEGDLFVKGNVPPGTIITVSGDVQIEGKVEKSNISCGKNLLIKEGCLGSTATYLRAGGHVYCKYFEYANVVAKGDIITDYAMDSNMESSGMIRIVGTKGAIVGGKSYAFEGISTADLGNTLQIYTEVSIGINDSMLEEYNNISKELQKRESELSAFKRAKKEMVSKYTQLQLRDSETFEKIRRAVDAVAETIEKLNEKKEEYLKLASELVNREITVWGKSHPNVRIVIDMKELNIGQELEGAVFKADTEKIIAYKM